LEIFQAGRKAAADRRFRNGVSALTDALRDTGNGFLGAVELQKNQLDPVAGCLPGTDVVYIATPG